MKRTRRFYYRSQTVTEILFGERIPVKGLTKEQKRLYYNFCNKVYRPTELGRETISTWNANNKDIINRSKAAYRDRHREKINARAREAYHANNNKQASSGNAER